MSIGLTQPISVQQSLTTDWSDADALKLEVLRLRDELLGAEAQLGELRARLLLHTERERFGPERQQVRDFDHLLAVNEDLQRQLDDLRSSTTWRIGRLIVRPLSALRRDTAVSGTASTG